MQFLVFLSWGFFLDRCAWIFKRQNSWIFLKQFTLCNLRIWWLHLPLVCWLLCFREVFFLHFPQLWIFCFFGHNIIQTQRRVQRIGRISLSTQCWVHHKGLLNVCDLQPNSIFSGQNLRAYWGIKSKSFPKMGRLML